MWRRSGFSRSLSLWLRPARGRATPRRHDRCRSMEIAMSRQTKNEIFETLPTKPVHVAGNSFRRASVSDLNPPLRWSSAAERLWSTAEPLGLRDTPATTYLEIRGGAFPWPNHLRYYPKLAHHRGGHVGPALLAMVTNATTGEKMTLQATWLAPDGSGKAQITPPRKCLFGHQKRGGTVRLTDDDEATMGLGIAEGIEDALSIREAIVDCDPVDLRRRLVVLRGPVFAAV